MLRRSLKSVNNIWIKEYGINLYDPVSYPGKLELIFDILDYTRKKEVLYFGHGISDVVKVFRLYLKMLEKSDVEI